MEQPNDLMIGRIVERFKALADENRIKLLMALKDGEHAVGDLAQSLGIGQASTSKHLAILRQGGLVQCRRDGNMAYYRARDEEIYKLCDLVCAGVGKLIAEEQQALGS